MLTKEQIRKKVLAYGDWEWWAERPHAVFIISLYAHGNTREYMKRSAGVDAEWPAILFQKGCYYKSPKVFDRFATELRRYLDSGGSVFKVVKACERWERKSKKQIASLIKSKAQPQEKYKQLYEIFSQIAAFVWLAHGLEHIYRPILYKEVAKYVPAQQVDKFVGDISYPIKQNAYHYLEVALRSKQSLAQIQRKFGWIKVRDGFSDGFTIQELKQEREDLKRTKPARFSRPQIPKPLRPLAKITQELVFFRTYRTDVLYELFWLAKPVFQEVAKFYGIQYKDLVYYSAQDLLKGKPKKYSKNIAWLTHRKHFALFNGPVFDDNYAKVSKAQGLVANPGFIIGKAKIVKTAYEIDKVKKGDILFAPTTAPSYILGMKKAAAFVTDEGGITSHAAIVSREMGKPCIIGTKIGTKLFKDGDLVEVDANKGTVRKI